MSEHIREQLQDIRTAIDNAAIAVGRDPTAVKLIAVSKTFPAADILEAYQYGQRDFGENKVQELEGKVSQLPKDIEWHYIGHLQSNKSSKALEFATWIHSVDSLKLLRRLERQAGELCKSPNLLIEVNISGESSKTGATVAEAETIVQAGSTCSNLRIKGLMTMPPFDADEVELRRIFSTLRQLRDEWQLKYNLEMPELSMGMSDDFAIAIAEGATMVRIGTAIFGGRNYV